MEELKKELVDILFLATKTEEISVERLFEVVDDVAPKILSAAKKYIMKDSIEGVAHPDDQEIWCDLDKYNLEDCEKVRIIVIKED